MLSLDLESLLQRRLELRAQAVRIERLAAAGNCREHRVAHGHVLDQEMSPRNRCDRIQLLGNRHPLGDAEVMHDREHQDEVEAAGRAAKQRFDLAVPPAECRRRPPKIADERENPEPALSGAVPDRRNGAFVDVERDDIALARRDLAVFPGVGADIERTPRSQARDGVRNEASLGLEVGGAVMAARRRITMPVGTAGREFRHTAFQLPFKARKRAAKDVARLVFIRSLQRGRRRGSRGRPGGERRGQRDAAPESRLQPTPKPKDFGQRFVRQACNGIRQSPGNRQSRFHRGNQRQEESRLELVACDPETVARVARDNRRQVDENRLRIAEQHVCRRRVLELPATRKERTGQFEGERPCGRQHFRRPFSRLADELDALVLEALAVEVGILWRCLDTRQRTRAHDATLVHPLAHDRILEHAPEVVERMTAHRTHQAAFMLDEGGVGIAERPRARGGRDQRGGSPDGGSELSSAAGASRRENSDRSLMRNSRK